MQLISQGAEARVYESTFASRPCVIKERFEKKYRLPELDKKLSHRRLIQEARCNLKCRRAGVRTPTIYMLDETTGRIYMEKLQGSSIKSYLKQQFSTAAAYTAEAKQVAYDIGVAIARMHDANIVHGDLTTSNIMFRDSTASSVTIIDFGLANSQPLPEDKAVDLYVMERAFNSSHIQSETLVNEILRAYKSESRSSDSIFQKLAQVRLRGRKRAMVG